MAIAPQTQDALSFTDVAFHFQVEGDADWTDASGHTSSVECGGYETQIGEAYTGSGNGAILTAGKTSPAEITVNSVYTENPAEIFKKLWDAKATKKKVRVKWSPKGGATGNWAFTSSYGFLQSVPPPQGEVSSPDVILAEIVMKAGQIDQSILP